jgi:hypothetical protein
VESVPATPLPHGLRARLEQSLATDLSAVRIGVDPIVAAMGARAIASGTEVRFAPGAYQPDTPEGEQLIAHEVAHLTQQAQGRVAPTRRVGEMAVNDDASLERDADDIGARALRGERVHEAAGAAPVPAAGAGPAQGFFDDLDRLGVLANELLDGTSTPEEVKAETGDRLPEGAATPDLAKGSIELQRILELGTLDTVETAIDALHSAQRMRDPLRETDRVAFGTDQGAYSLELAQHVTDAMIPALETRKEELINEAEDPVWGPFARTFNQEFADVLHVFGLRRERDDKQRDHVMAARLKFLFTDRQRELLTAYCTNAEKPIPDRLFDDDPGLATAQQRIVLASKILADGTYTPGSYVQEVHARACFHWARIVYQYAGVATEKSTQGLTGSFDLMGGVVLGSGRIREPFHGKKDESLDPSASHLDANPNAYRFGNAPWNLVQELQPGDWLYIYNGNKSGSGAHSVIFAGWDGEEGTTASGRRYRRAVTFDQGMPDQGGNRHRPVLGEDMFPTPDGMAHPVNNIMRVAPDARPADEVSDLTPELSRKVHKNNQAFVAWLLRKHGKGKTFDHAELMARMRAANVTLIARIDAVEGRLTDRQRDLLHEANASSNETDVICLMQRLYALAENSDLLAEKMKTTYADGIDATNTAAIETYIQQATDMQAQIALQSAEVTQLDDQADPLRERLDKIDPAPELKELRATRKQLGRELSKISAKHKEERRKKRAQIAAIDVQIAAAKAEEKAHRPEIKELHRQLDKLEKAERVELRKLDKLVDQLEALYPMTEYGLVHTSNSQGQVTVVLDGRYEHIPLDMKWQTLVVSAPGAPAPE